MEAESKCQDEEEEDGEERNEGSEYVGEHHHVDTEPRQFTDKQHELDPREEDRYGPQVPLPVLKVHVEIYH